MGLTVELESGKPVRDALLQAVSLSALSLRREGGKTVGKITSIKPENEAERAALTRAVFELAALFKGKKSAVVLDDKLCSYIRGLPAQASYTMTRKDAAWHLTDASQARLRKFGNYWIAIEIPRSGPAGIFLSVFTDRFGPVAGRDRASGGPG